MKTYEETYRIYTVTFSNKTEKRDGSVHVSCYAHLCSAF